MGLTTPGVTNGDGITERRPNSPSAGGVKSGSTTDSRSKGPAINCDLRAAAGATNSGSTTDSRAVVASLRVGSLTESRIVVMGL